VSLVPRKQPEPCAHNVIHRGDGRREDLVRHNLIFALRQTSFQSLFPRQTQLRVDVNDVDPGADRLFQIFIRVPEPPWRISGTLVADLIS
jgi:hypothetical protein